MRIKRIIAVIFALSLLINHLHCFAGEEPEALTDRIDIAERVRQAEASGHRYAYAVVEDSRLSMTNGMVRTNRWNSAEKGTSVSLYDFRMIEYRGKKALESTASDQSNIFITLEGEYWEREPGKRLAVTIEYIDTEKASLGFFTPTGFHQLSSAMSTEHEAVITQGTGEWKTVTYYIDDFVKGTLRLRTPAIQPFIGIPNKVPIGNIFIEEGMAETPLAMDAEAELPGRIFRYGHSDRLKLTYENTQNTSLRAELRYTVRNYEGRAVYKSALDPIGAEAGESGEVSLLTGVTERGTYRLELTLTVTDENGNRSVYTRDLKFSIMDALSEGEPRNPLVGVCDGISDNFYGGGYSGAEQLAVLPVGAVRLGGLDNISVEPSQGVYQDPTLKDRQYHSDNGMEIFALAYQLQSWYNGGRAAGAYPDTDEAHRGYADYAAYLAKLPYVDTIEMFNEWNHSGFSILDQSAEGYLAYCKVAYPAIKAAAKEAGKEVTVLAGGCAGFASNWIERFIRLGGLDYCDGLSYHPYQYRSFDYKAFKEQTDQVTRWMTEYHGSTKPITLTEMGIPEAEDKETTKAGYEHWDKMRSLPGMYIMAQHSGAYDTIYYYNMHSTGYAPDQREPGFGLFEFVGMSDGNRLTATDAAVTFAAYMKMLTGAEPGRKIEADDYKKLAYEFTRQDGEKIAALWTSGQHRTWGIDLGIREVTVYDQFGNYKETLFSENGCFDFDLTDEIVYIQGNFVNFEEAESRISLSDGVISAPVGDMIRFSLEDTQKRSLKAELDYDPDVFTFEEYGAMSDGRIAFAARLREGVTGRYHIGVRLMDADGKTVYYARPAADISTALLDVSLSTAQVSQTNDRRWAVRVNVTNRSATQTLYGTVSLLEPSEFVSERSFSELLPGETRTVVINLPEMVVKRPQQMKFRVSLDNGVETVINQKLDFTAARKVGKKPVIDGKIGKDEWNSTLLSEDRGSRYTTLIKGTAWGGVSDVSVTHRILWDEENFYMMAVVRDNVHYTAQKDPDSMWQDDSIQFGILENREETLDAASMAFTELCISANPAGDTIYRHSSAAGSGTGVVENRELKIARENGRTIYEMRIPWSELLSEHHTAKEGDEYAFSFLINDNDGDGRKGYMYYNDGIGGEKLPSLFGKLRLY